MQALGRVRPSLGWNWAEVTCASPELPGGPEQAPHGQVPSREASVLSSEKLALNFPVPESLSGYACVFHAMPCVCIWFPQIEGSSF